ncbi:kinesin-like protein 3A isoform X1 [Megachile rotundata]|uniref:kinesin-like protein 3A isoform X1 n=1 Tax=Megachile rotundata TaxID=143995 RepID=UPI000258DFCE|nr:PREDICTED: chromosome-associated kinesin KIF4 isoform X2 [Megachile rotundata]XP_012140026.1 PREDICTED: chromosome-associated kinesin KIF4 isoform X2 [Megachile rotundata]XP_012140027.1 PREDICTED: chromosome-associated kinesin KIF4 isoform X2 [Megachile rotundata]XP_012140028.1 PREDICTED: chromosome-associated kinesin KIF4 isoform X2 [Megachile rotundata]XP_012140029.1 PREDICTED: chromosome-associated kinesin KIF4 isoform X2 [Megachile rotundata]XP_012140030.1 PREDICTED: chromosome-associat
MSEDTVRVAVRIRPLVKTEVERGCQICLNVVPGEPQIVIQNTDKAFTFNYVFPPEIGQEDFYNTAIKDMVKNIFQGYNVTILAYGQTGSGKTHSMGTNYVEAEDMGVIPRAVHDIFSIISSKEDWNFKITVSFMELYQEQLYDLLADKQRNQSIVDIRDDGKNIKVAGVVEKEVKTAVETLQCLTQGSLGRATGATAMNANSSRSHAIFTLCIYQQNKTDPNMATTAKFHLVDLAGSERSKKTQATGERFKEGVNINKGLLALGNVISQLGEGGSMSYVGYRDSKLTRLLQDSLGGNSMTLMIACVSPADYNLDETLSTLRYADRARKIKNKPVVNQDPKVAEINRLNKLVQELKLALVGQEINVSCPIEHQELEVKNQSLQQKIKDLTEKLNANLIEAIIMHERAELAEQAREKIQSVMSKILEECKELMDDFNKNPNTHSEYYIKLEAIYLKILDIQNDQKKTTEELMNHGVSSTVNIKSFTANNEEVSEQTSIDEASSEISDSLDDFDEKQEEHTLLQVKRNNEVQNINKELAIKESLICQLLKNSSHVIDYSKEKQDMEQEIKALQTEKEELLQTLQNVHANNASSKLAESRRKKVQELEKKITELRRKVMEQDKIVKMKEKQDQQIKNLLNETQLLKQTRVKLIRQMRIESDKFTKWKTIKEKELNKLKDQNRKQVNEVTRLKMWHNKQETVFKRKMEEAFAVNKRLKEALDLQKRAAMRRDKTNNVDKIKNWLIQEIEILVSTVDAEHSLEKLMQDRASLACMLDKFQNNSNTNEQKIVELTQFLDLRNTQISDLQQKIIESDQENRSHQRWQKIQTMEDAKAALKLLFKHIAEDRRKQCVKESEFLEKCTLLQTQLDEYQAKEQNGQSIISNTNYITQNDNEENINLQEELKYYKEKCQQLEQKVLNEIQNTSEVSKPKGTKKAKKTVEIDQEFIYPATDDSIVENDDTENDPDWTQTPLYNRIQKLLSTTKNSSLDHTTLKRSSDGDIKCSCKTKCATRLCSCRKNKVICSNCNCNPECCQNRDKNLNRTLFVDYKENETEDSIKKPRGKRNKNAEKTLIKRELNLS